MRNAKLYVTAAAVCATSVVAPAALSAASAGSPLDFLHHLFGGAPHSVPVSPPSVPQPHIPVLHRPISIPQVRPISIPVVIPDVHEILDKLPEVVWPTPPTTWGPKDPASATTEQSAVEGCEEACG